VSERILVVDDEPSLVRGLSYALGREGFDVAVETDGLRAVLAATEHDVDLVVLDRMLPSLDGVEVCRRIRESRTVPVIMLTALDTERDLLEGLDAGADDYLTKPFSSAELVARIRALLRRRELDRLDHVQRREVAGLTIDLASDTVELDGRPVSLTPSEFKILRLLASEPGAVFSRRTITQHLWDSPHVGDEHTCQVHISSLRKKIEDDPGQPTRLLTVRGRGYALAV
jgi:DNA-binding response OmpR family regulator